MARLPEVDEYYLEIEVTLRDECEMGDRTKILVTLRRKISAYSRNDDKVRKVYIGIASGVNYTHALWRRYDDFKHSHGINEIIAVYKSSSQSSCRYVERDLTDFYERNFADRLINRDAGGAGRPTSQPYNYVYLAIQRLG
jgi:hypothetical protein